MGQQKFWEEQKRVDSFANKAADHRLKEIIKEYPLPGSVKILDLGCAGGRNTVFLAQKGFDVWALDSSHAMVEKTKSLLKAIWSLDKNNSRIFTASMENLHWAKDGFFDLVIALGLYHNAESQKMFRKAIQESARVLKAGGRILVANFAPGVSLEHLDLEKEKHSKHMWKDKTHGKLCLLTGDELDFEMKRIMLFPVTKTQTVVKQLERGKRVTVNALYKKGPN